MPELSKHNRIHHQSTFFEWWGHENPTQNSLRKQPKICNIKLPLVSPPNDVWEMSKEIPYWWRITTQIWVVLLTGWINHVARPIRSTTQIWVVMCHLYGISVLVSQQHLVRKPLVVSPNVCFFLRLKPKQNFRKSKKDTCKHCDQILIF